MKKNIIMAIGLVLIFLISKEGFSWPVPDTGQTKCYDDTGEIPCPSPGEDFYGQDASYSINSMSFTKLDEGGKILPYSAKSWAMVLDNVTGLIWEVKQKNDKIPDYVNLHDSDNAYTWYKSNDFIHDLNDDHFGGYSDWRLPNRKELRSIVDYSIPYPGPCINTAYFPNTQPSHYWSSTINSDFINEMLGIYMKAGIDSHLQNIDHYYVRAVRGEQGDSLNSFVNNNDGTITDTSTGLMWQQDTAPEKSTWKDALAYCKNLSLGGHSDWRLPTIKELDYIVDLNIPQPGPTINTVYFPDTKADLTFYCSSTTDNINTDDLFCIIFYAGSNNGSYHDKSYRYYVRAVRDVRNSIGDDNDGDGYTTAQGDCNDNNRSIHPGAIEKCGDGIDQDCDGKDESCMDAPSAPTGMAASDGTLSGKVQVSWSPATSATTYDVYRADMPAWTGTVPKRIASSISGTSYDDTSAASGNRYYYWVKSRNSGGVSKYSNFDPGYWGTMGTIPAKPTNVSATDGTVSGKVNITWDTASNSLVYEVWRADIPAFLGGNIKKIGTSTTTFYSDTTVVSGNRYYYWVKARNSWGVTRYSLFDTGFIGTASLPLPAPTGVSATDGTISGKVTITWNATPGAVVCEVWRATKLVSEGGKLVRVGFLSATSFDDTSGTPGTTYYYWVKARDSWGSSKYSVPDTGYYN